MESFAGVESEFVTSTGSSMNSRMQVDICENENNDIKHECHSLSV